MKNSGIEWIGEIPTKWFTTKVKYYYNCLDGKRKPVDSGERKSGPYPYWGAGSITDYVDDYIFDEEIVLLGEDGAPFFDKSRPVSFLVNEKVWINNHIHVLKPHENINPKFLVYWFNNVDYKTYINGSILNKLTQSNMNNIAIAVPSYEEQTRIANFLDKKVAAIDTVITKTKESIEEYKKLKQTIITEVVTKGLNPNVEMKESNIVTIGLIPAHWHAQKVKFVLKDGEDSIKVGPFGSAIRGKMLAEGKYKVYNQAHLINNDFNLSRHFISEDTYNELQQYRVVPGDILFSMMGTIGKCRIMPEGYQEGIMDSHLIKGRLNSNKINKKYFELVYDKDFSRVVIDQFLFDSKGTIMDGLNSSLIKNVYIPVPPIEEQEKIVDFLTEKCNVFDKLIEKKMEELGLFEKYKKSLIYEYVTGKKAVPNE